MTDGAVFVSFTGNLTADPELRFTASGAAVASFTVACQKRVKNQQTDAWEDGPATFLRCTVWRQFAENVAESLHRGARVNVTGELQQRSYETREGEKRTTFEVQVQTVGPDLKFKTVQVLGADRQQAQQQRRTQPDDDPWGSTPSGYSGRTAANQGGGFSDEPPF